MNSDIIPIEIINLSSTNIPISTNIQSLDYQIGVSGVNNELIEVAVKDNVVVGDLPYYEGNYDVINPPEVKFYQFMSNIAGKIIQKLLNSNA